MRTRKQWTLFTLAVVAVALCGWAVADWRSIRPYEWQEVQSPDSQFRISFPGIPTVSQTRETAFVSYRFAVSPNDGALYAVSWWENPSQKSKSTDELFADFSSCNIKTIHGKIVGEKRFEVQGHPAQDTMLAANGQMVVNRVIRVGPRLYSLWVFDSAWHLGRGDAKRFLSSLSVR